MRRPARVLGILGGSLLAGLLDTTVLFSRVPALSEADVGPWESGRE